MLNISLIGAVYNTLWTAFFTSFNPLYNKFMNHKNQIINPEILGIRSDIMAFVVRPKYILGPMPGKPN